MKVKNVVFSIFMMLLPCVVLAEKCDQGAGWYYNSSIQECQKCDTGNYCDGEIAKSCPDGFPNSAEGAKSAEECYKSCELKDGGATAGTGTQYNKTGAKCVISSCSDNYTKVQNAPSNASANYQGYCLETEKDCSRILGTSCKVYTTDCKEDSNVSQGSVTGKAKVTDTTNGNYNLTTTCKCQVSGRHDTSTGTYYIDYYSYSNTCNHFVNSSRIVEVAKCDAGFCKLSTTSTTACQKTPVGYYHTNDGGKDCQLCPAGQTSALGSDSKSDCHYSSETQFCDNNGCISLSQPSD